MQGMQTMVKHKPGAPETDNADPVLGIVRLLREPGALAARITKAWSEAEGAPSLRAASILHTHYKPWTRARILAKAIVSSGDSANGEATQLLYLQTYTTRERALRKFADCMAAEAAPCLGPAVSLLADCNTVVWSLPNGPKLEAIRICFDPAAFAAFLTDAGLPQGSSGAPPPLPQLIRYVPRQRALFLCSPSPGDGGRLYIKFYRPGEDLIGAGNLKALSAAAERAALGFRVPRLVAHAVELRAVVMDEVPGIQLTDFLSDPRPDMFAAVGRALARLHMCDVTPALSWTPELEMSALRKAMVDVVKAQPDLDPILGHLLERIDRERRRLSFGDRRPIHGNLFADQILVDGDQVGIVDWDDLPLGDPLFDVGRLIAHLIFVSRQCGLVRAPLAGCVRLMLESYARESGKPLAVDRLSWQVCVALLMRAKISALRTLPPSWRDELAATVEEAATLLDHHSMWVPA